MPAADFANDLVFLLNGREVRLYDVDPTVLLVDYLRSAEVGLTGTKWVCRQGGCGACTVMLSHNHGAEGKTEHAAINSCLRPLCSLDGMAITTTEGIGSAARGGSLDRVQKSIAENNGSQCGYCTPGWVMNMYSFLQANEGRTLTEEQIEAACDGNLCRCTGYRPILKAFKKFAGKLSGTSAQPVLTRGDSGAENDPARKAEFRAETLLHPARSSADRESDLKVVTQCLADAKVAAVTNAVVAGGQMQLRFDEEAAEVREGQTGLLTAELEAEIEQFLHGLEAAMRDVKAPRPGARPVYYTNGRHHWYRAVTLAQLYELLVRHKRDDVKLVVGNTSIGVYNRHLENPHVLIDIAHIPELHEASIGDRGITLGAAVTYSEAAELLDEALATLPPEQLSTIRAARYMIRRTAGTIVRNAASLAGNTMMVTSHVKEGEPFPSDLFPVLCATGATLTIGLASGGDPLELALLDFVARWNDDEEFRHEAVILRYFLPLSAASEYVEPYKVALREVNAHALVNACFRVLFDGTRVAACALVVSGTGPLAYRARRAEKALTGSEWTSDTLMEALEALAKDVEENIEASRERMSSLPDVGITDDYRRDAATAFFYKFIVGVSAEVRPELVDDFIKSAGMRFVRPVSQGTQVYPQPVDTPPLGLPVIKRAAFLQATGEAKYTEEMPFPQNGLHAVIVVSPKAWATYTYVLPDGAKCSDREAFVAALRALFHGFHDYVTAEDIPGNKLGGMAGDEPYLLPFGSGEVNWFGQPLGIVLAETAEEAEDVAYVIRTQCLAFKNAGTPILTIEEAIEKKSIFPDAPASAPFITHAYELLRAGSDMKWAKEKGPRVRKAVINGKKCVVVSDTIWTPDQTHFYMQPNGCWVVPEEDDAFSVYPASQSPMEIHTTVAAALGLPFNKIKVQITRIGGGFGGKTERSKFVAAAAAIAASKAKRPVRLVMRRDDDTAMTGKAHAWLAGYQLAVSDEPADRGTLAGVAIDLHSDGGFTYDCSFIVGNCVQMRFDGPYFAPNYRTRLDICKTNKASNTAFRAFGMLNSSITYEDAIEAAAHALDLDPAVVREKSLYCSYPPPMRTYHSDDDAEPEKEKPPQTTPFDQPLDPCYMQDVWEHLKKSCNYAVRRARVEEFNAKNRWRKRGIAMIPIKYGTGFNATFLQQGSGLIGVYSGDGTVFIRQGGVEMGQGLQVKVAQVAANALNVPLEMIAVGPTDTQVTPNPTSTGASTGASFNGGAIEDACKVLRSRLEEYCFGLQATGGEQLCRSLGIDFWNYPEGWRAKPDGKTTIWSKIIGNAYMARIDLTVQAAFRQPGGNRLISGVTTHPIQGTPQKDWQLGLCEFTSFTYSAACSEVEVDVLSGETTILRTDICYDTGRSLNPAVDVGQVEGAFMMGVGSVLSEHVAFEHRDKENLGRLNALNTWEYKPPAATTVPIQLNVELYWHRPPGAMNDSRLLFSSKEVGEPPMVLASSVYLAIKRAVLAARRDKLGEKPEWFTLPCPATPQAVREACLVELEDLRLASE